MFWAVSDKAMLYPDRISISFTLIREFLLVLKHIFQEKKYCVVYSYYFWSLSWHWSPIELTAIKAHSKRKSLSQDTYILVSKNSEQNSEKKKGEKNSFSRSNSKDNCLDFLDRSFCLLLSVMSVVWIYSSLFLLQKHSTLSKNIKPCSKRWFA